MYAVGFWTLLLRFTIYAPHDLSVEGWASGAQQLLNLYSPGSNFTK